MHLVKIVLLAWLALYFFCLPSYAKANNFKVIINLPSKTLALYSQEVCIKEYPVAIGKPSTPTPLGEFSIQLKEVNPTWYPNPGGDFVPSGPENPLGYRWLGFFKTYGIHGTNAPWSIGEAASNGCIRMQEIDVEELYEMIPLETPVRVTYDRCKVKLASNGEVSIGIYPDVYGFGSLGMDEIKSVLAANQVSGWLSDSYLWQLLQNGAGSQMVFANLFPIKVNETTLPLKATRFQGINYIPVRVVAEALGIEIGWDERNQLVYHHKSSVQGYLRGEHAYVLPEDLERLLNIKLFWSEDEQCFLIKTPVVFLNDKVIGHDIRSLEGVLAVPVLSLAKALGQQVVWDSAKNLIFIRNKSFPVGVFDGQPYLKITKIWDCFGAYTYWNEKANTLELTYPFYAK